MAVADARLIEREKWCTDKDLTCPGDMQADDVARAINAAQEILLGNSGAYFGVSKWQLRPYDYDCGSYDIVVAAPNVPLIWDVEVRTPDRQPLLTIEQVIAYDGNGDETIVDESKYRLYGNEIVFNEGLEVTLSQSPRVPLGQPYTWAVTVRAGIEVPDAGRFACIDLAQDIVSGGGCCGITVDQCEVPSNTKQLQRNNVAYEFDLRKFGIKSVDRFIMAFPKEDEQGDTMFGNPLDSSYSY